jgi:hypothetical protein
MSTVVRVADDLPLVAELHHLATKLVVLGAEPGHLQCLRHRQLELRGLHRLRYVVDRARLDRGDRMLDARVAGEHDQRDVVSLASQHLEELEPGDPRHAIIGDDELHLAARQDLQRLGDVAGAERAVPRALESVFEDEPDRRLVVYVEDCRHDQDRTGEAGDADRPHTSVRYSLE